MRLFIAARTRFAEDALAAAVRNGTRLQSGDVVLTQADGDDSLGSQFEAAR